MTKTPECHVFQPSGGVPNSPLPLVFWRGRLPADRIDGRAACALYKANGWTGTWVYTVFPYWHFHTRGHEVLSCVSGSATIGFGGEGGLEVKVAPGDVCVIPAGVGHRRLHSSDDFQMAGGYPPGQEGDIVREGAMDTQEAMRRIASVELPSTDPITGKSDGVVAVWRAAMSESHQRESGNG